MLVPSATMSPADARPSSINIRQEAWTGNTRKYEEIRSDVLTPCQVQTHFPSSARLSSSAARARVVREISHEPIGWWSSLPQVRDHAARQGWHVREGKVATRSGKYWSAEVTQRSNALDLEPGCSPEQSAARRGLSQVLRRIERAPQRHPTPVGHVDAELLHQPRRKEPAGVPAPCSRAGQSRAEGIVQVRGMKGTRDRRSRLMGARNLVRSSISLGLQSSPLIPDANEGFESRHLTSQSCQLIAPLVRHCALLRTACLTGPTPRIATGAYCSQAIGDRLAGSAET